MKMMEILSIDELLEKGRGKDKLKRKQKIKRSGVGADKRPYREIWEERERKQVDRAPWKLYLPNSEERERNRLASQANRAANKYFGRSKFVA